MGMIKHVDTSSHLGLDPQDWPWEKSLPIFGEPGDAVLFHVKTIHGSQTNQSSAPRPVFIHRYRAANDYVVIGGTSVKNREKAEAAAEQARKDNQRGFMVAGRRRFEARG
jgi:ectoine hydroxylase-related dioxygenase (phytanoyl-CoA dioxygenase family)